jgi:hypothetical protein
MLTGSDTITCFAGDLRTLYRPSLSLRIRAASSKRDIIESNGFSAEGISVEVSWVDIYSGMGFKGLRINEVL